MRGRTTFHEVMRGAIRVRGDNPTPRRLALTLTLELPGLLLPWSDVEAAASGRVEVPGWAAGAAEGTVRIAPLPARRIRYRLGFTALDGRRLHLDGWKSITPRHPVRSMTVLPVTVTDQDGEVVADGTVRFDLRRDLARFLGSFRYRRRRVHLRGRATTP